MGSIKLKLHLLTFPFALYFALTGRLIIFVVYTLSAVVHELGHAFSACKVGYRLNKITLMPFGAVVSGDECDFRPIDEIKIALAGPFMNLAVGMFFVALWWVFPELYAYTDVAAEANFALAFINFIPAYPLDGGRVLCASLSMVLGRKKAFIICKILGVLLSSSLFGLFVFSCFVGVNLTLLFFSLFVISGVFINDKENVYVRISTFFSIEKMKKGVPFKKQGVDKSVTLKELLSVVDTRYINEIVVFDGDREIANLSQKTLSELIKTVDLYAPIEEHLEKIVKN